MMKKVLIANRGEIAVRIIRACKELGIETVAVYSEADEEALHVQLADEAYCIGPRLSTDSYLNFSNIISVANLTNCDGIHPGYGFLAENASFAELCEECNIEFIGPTSDAISRMGTKDVARETMRKAGVQLCQGQLELLQMNTKHLKSLKKSDFLLLLKRLQAAAVKVYVLPEIKKILLKVLKSPKKKRQPLLEIQVFILKNTLKFSDMLKFKCC